MEPYCIGSGHLEGAGDGECGWGWPVPFSWGGCVRTTYMGLHLLRRKGGCETAEWRRCEQAA